MFSSNNVGLEIKSDGRYADIWERPEDGKGLIMRKAEKLGSSLVERELLCRIGSVGIGFRRATG